MSLLQSHPLLLVLRRIGAWWDLRAAVDSVPLEAEAVAAALAAWLADDRQGGDEPGAAAHEALTRDLRRALEIGVPEAFAERAAARAASAPEQFVDGLRRVDAYVLDHLGDGGEDALAAAAEVLDDLIRQGSIDDAPPLFQLALFSDGARLFDAVLRTTQDDEMLRRVIACCDVVIQLRRKWDQHPAGALLNLDPRLQSMAGLVGERLGTRYARVGDPEDLTRAVQMAEAALNLTGPSAPDRPLFLAEYAQALGFRDDETSLATATESLREAVDLEPPSSLRRTHFRVQYGSGLVALARHERFGALLEQGIAALREAKLERGGDREPLLAYRLGAALRLLYDREGDAQALSDAVELLGEAVAAEGRPLQPGDQRLEELYLAVEGLAARYRARGDQAELERALRGLLGAFQGTQTLAGGPNEWLAQQFDPLLAQGPDAPEALANYAVLMLALYDNTKADVHLEAPLRLLRVAAAAERDPKRRSGQLAELARGLALRYERDGHRPDLDEAIARAEAARAAALEASDALTIAVARSTLGALLGKRFERNGNSDDLGTAIEEAELAVADRELLEPEPRSGFLSNLGALIRSRAALLRLPGDEQLALDVLLEALQIAETYHTSNLRLCLHNVAGARHAVFQQTHRRRDLDKAISAWRRALLEDSKAPMTRLGLARVLLDRHAVDRNRASPGDLDEALQLLESAFEDSGERSPDRPACANALARALELRARRDGGEADVQRARRLSAEACELALEVALEYALFTGADWGERATTRRSWDEAVEAYSYGIRALQRLVGPQALRPGKLAWLRHAWGMSANAAFAWAKTGDADAAVVSLEGTRGLLISEARGVNRFPLDELEGTPYRLLVDRFRAAVERWGTMARQASAEAVQDGDAVEHARLEVEDAIVAIRTIPGYEGFLGYPTIDDVRAAAVEPLVYLVPARVGGVALIVRPDGSDVEVVWLRRLTEKRVRTQATAFVSAYRHRHVGRDRWVAAVDDVGRWLWDAAMRTVLGRLDAGRVVLIPTGLLGLLPLHTAWVADPARPTGRRYAADDVVISFASTAQALLSGQRLAANVEPASVLVVQEPEPVFLPRLANAEGEAAAAVAAFQTNTLFIGRNATVEHVVPKMAEAPVIHFACHALSSIEDPSRSGIVLAFDRLLDPGGLATVSVAQARLVILSACETGVYGGQAPDEAVGLPNAFVEAGVGGVLASLWEVVDASAMVLLARFYELWRREGHDAVEALVGAQRWLRDTTNAEKRSHWTEAWRRGELPEATFDAATTDQLFRDPDARDFEHPVHWAAFTFMGAW